jgi:hypothetical protein
MKDYSMYKYYKGEENCPIYGALNAGKMFWWGVEKSAYRNGDKKELNKLSETMLNFLHEWHWEPDKALDWELAAKRAEEMYNKGLWSTQYFDFEHLKEVEKTDYLGKEYLHFRD